MKYIIKNCPNYLPDFFYFGACKCEKGSSINGRYIDNCKDVTDCLLKQVVEKCKKAQKTQWVNNKKKPYSPSKSAFARDILKDLEIEEVND